MNNIKHIYKNAKPTDKDYMPSVATSIKFIRTRIDETLELFGEPALDTNFMAEDTARAIDEIELSLRHLKTAMEYLLLDYDKFLEETMDIINRLQGDVHSELDSDLDSGSKTETFKINKPYSLYMDDVYLGSGSVKKVNKDKYDKYSSCPCKGGCKNKNNSKNIQKCKKNLSKKDWRTYIEESFKIKNPDE